jgi:hypothetical protein
LKGGFGSLRKINALYEIQDEPNIVSGLWDGSTSTQHQPAIQPSRYQSLLDQGLPTFQVQDNDVRYWSDFNRVFYHPRSAVQLNKYELNSQLMPFEKWTAGEDLFEDQDKEVDILDRDVRPFAEECDHMQGFQIFTGVDDAWGGFASRYVDSLRDEYGKTSMWTWGIERTAPVPLQTRVVRVGNTAKSTQALGQQSSVYVNLSTLPKLLPNYIDLHSQSEWSSSALMCAAVESITLPTRLINAQSRQASLSLLEDTLNTNGNQRLLELQMSVDGGTQPLTNGHTNGLVNGDHDQGEDTSDQVDDLDATFLSSYSQSRAHRIHTFAQTEVRRSQHIPESAPEMDPGERLRMRLNEETIIDRYNTRLLFPILDTFPDTLLRRTTGADNSKIPLIAALRTSSNLKTHVLELRDAAMRGGIERDEREDIYNGLTEIATAYSFGWDEGSDEGDDD